MQAVFIMRIQYTPHRRSELHEFSMTESQDFNISCDYDKLLLRGFGVAKFPSAIIER